MPSIAARELRRLPVDLLETIIEGRSYAHAKAIFDNKGKKDPYDTPLINLVKEITFEIEKERRAQKTAQAHG